MSWPPVRLLDVLRSSYYKRTTALIPTAWLANHLSTSVLPISFYLVAVLILSQGNIGPSPEMAQVKDGEGKADAHLAGHDDEAHVPAKHSDDKE